MTKILITLPFSLKYNLKIVSILRYIKIAIFCYTCFRKNHFSFERAISVDSRCKSRSSCKTYLEISKMAWEPPYISLSRLLIFTRWNIIAPFFWTKYLERRLFIRGIYWYVVDQTKNDRDHMSTWYEKNHQYQEFLLGS